MRRKRNEKASFAREQGTFREQRGGRMSRFTQIWRLLVSPFLEKGRSVYLRRHSDAAAPTRRAFPPFLTDLSGRKDDQDGQWRGVGSR